MRKEHVLRLKLTGVHSTPAPSRELWLCMAVAYIIAPSSPPTVILSHSSIRKLGLLNRSQCQTKPKSLSPIPNVPLCSLIVSDKLHLKGKN